MKKTLLTAVLLAAISVSLSALDFVFKFEPAVLFPLEDTMQPAPGGIIQGDFDFFNIFTPGFEGGYFFERPQGGSDGMNVIFGGLNLGIYYYPLSRLYLGAGASFGVNSLISKISRNGEASGNDIISDLYYRAFAELGFRLNPSVSINLTGGYASYNFTLSNSFFSGPFAGLSLRMNGSVGNKSKSSAISARVEQDGDVFPVLSYVYSYEPFGTIFIRNEEGAELRNVHVSFRAGKYTTGTKLCGVVDRINRHSTVDVPLYADFSDQLLQFTENGKLSGEILIEYEFLGKKMSAVEPVVISVYNRNAFIWSDNAALAAFISPDSQEVAAFAKEIAGITRNNIYTGMNANLQYAMGIIEGLRLIGISYSEDTVTPYKVFHTTYDLDSIQYPLQTLQYLSGDYDDIGVLVCSCLQVVNVPSGYMATPDDFIVLVKLNIGTSQVLSNFASTNGLIIDEENDEVYLALSMANISKGFTASYKAGSEEIIKCFSDEENSYEFIDTGDAWSVYKPLAYSNSANVISPKQDELIKNIKAAIQAYITSDIEEVIKRARSEGDSNRLGVALVRAGRYSEAKKEFQKAANAGSIAAMNNVANILMIEKNYTAAAEQYKSVLKKDPENQTAIKGLENANSKIE